MKLIKLTQGKSAKVNNKDFKWLKKYKWAAHRKYKGKYYAVTNSSINGCGKNKAYPMHRAIMNPRKGMEVDHINHNGLDNRKRNLRICTRRDNMTNRIKKKNSTSVYHGVDRVIKDKYKYWRSRIIIKNKQIHLGLFKYEKEAGIAFNKALEKYKIKFQEPNKIKTI